MVITCFKLWNSWTLQPIGYIFAAFSIMPFLKNIWNLTLLATDAQNLSMLTGSGVSSAIILISIGFIVDLLLRSVSSTEPSLYESNTRSILVAFLHMASNMFKKDEQKSVNVRKTLILIFLSFAITSARYFVVMLVQPEGGTISSMFKHFSIPWHRAPLTGFFNKPSSSNW